MKNLLVALFFSLVATAANANCRQALALGLDVSGSVNEREYALQREGLAQALLSPRVSQAIFEMPDAPVRLFVFEWSANIYQRMLVDWTELRAPSDLRLFVENLRGAPVENRPYSTALGGAMKFGVAQLSRHPECWRRTLDISGDGITNDGPLPNLLFRGSEIENIVINGLVIGSGDKEGDPGAVYATDQLATYFENTVVRGPDAFVEKAIGFDDFKAAMERKLLREMSTLALGGWQLPAARQWAELGHKNQ